MKTSVLTMADLTDSLALYRTAADAFPDLSEQSFRDALTRNLRRGTALGLRCGTALAGMLLFSPLLSRISFLAVDPAFRRQGIGRALVCAALDRLGGHAELFTYAPEDPEAPGAALGLYRALGFVETGSVPGYRTPVIRMEKT